MFIVRFRPFQLFVRLPKLQSEHVFSFSQSRWFRRRDEITPKSFRRFDGKRWRNFSKRLKIFLYVCDVRNRSGESDIAKVSFSICQTKTSGSWCDGKCFHLSSDRISHRQTLVVWRLWIVCACSAIQTIRKFNLRVCFTLVRMTRTHILSLCRWTGGGFSANICISSNEFLSTKLKSFIIRAVIGSVRVNEHDTLHTIVVAPLTVGTEARVHRRKYFARCADVMWCD